MMTKAGCRQRAEMTKQSLNTWWDTVQSGLSVLHRLSLVINETTCSPDAQQACSTEQWCHSEWPWSDYFFLHLGRSVWVIRHQDVTDQLFLVVHKEGRSGACVCVCVWSICGSSRLTPVKWQVTQTNKSGKWGTANILFLLPSSFQIVKITSK